MVAVVRLRDENNFRPLVMEYETKKEYLQDLKANGYIVRSIYTDKQWGNLAQVLEDRENKRIERMMEI